MTILSIFFLVTALIYSSVGFGGGSTYLALLLLWGIPYTIFPIIALACNIIVVSGNSFNYIRAGNLNFKLLLPYLFGSIPFAFIGGSLQIEKELFEIILFFVLGIAGILLLINFKSYGNNSSSYKTLPIYFSLLIGIILGFVSGIVVMILLFMASILSWIVIVERYKFFRKVKNENNKIGRAHV